MERLWAPWRMAYIGNLEETDGCFLCAAGASPERDRETRVIWRGQKAFCILNRFPYNNGHLLVAPYRHEGDLTALDPDERMALMDGVSGVCQLLRRVLCPHGFNVGMNLGKVAGAGLAEHMHVHIVPRWDGDTNFMPVLADTKVVPQALSDLYDRLVEAMGQEKPQCLEDRPYLE